MIETYRDLRVWQRAMDLVVAAYDIAKLLPRDELFALSAQMKRSATSVAANMAEGYGRGSTGAYVNQLSIARGSLKECETHVLAAIRLHMTTEMQASAFFDLSQQVGKMLNGLIDSLQR